MLTLTGEAEAGVGTGFTGWLIYNVYDIYNIYNIYNIYWGGRGWCWDRFHRLVIQCIIIYTALQWGLDCNHWNASKDIHQGMGRCRFVGEKDSQDHHHRHHHHHH